MNTIDAIRELWRQRTCLHKAEKSLTLQIRAMCRHACDPGKDVEEKERLAVMKKQGDKLYKSIIDNEASHDLFHHIEPYLLPFLMARETLETNRGLTEKRLDKLAKELPVAKWATSVKGIGLGSLAALVGEAGDLSNYATVSRLWKRMGVAVVGEIRQQKVAGEGALDHGYSPRRRSVLWNIGGALIGGMGHGPRPFVGEDISARIDLTEYQKLFVERCREEVAKNPDMGRPPVEKDGVLKESYSAHCSARAKRYVEKRWLIDIWRAWNAAAMPLQKAA